jgi:hypothetical protein
MWFHPADRVTLPPAQLLLYAFGPDASFEGHLVGALERIESGGALRILDALFVTSDPETSELVAIDLRGGAGGIIVAPLLDFRLDPASRRRATERALSPHASGLPAEALRELGAALEPGAAMVALLVEHAWAKTLEDAVSRTGGTPLASEFVQATTLAELAPAVVAAAGHGGESATSG